MALIDFKDKLLEPIDFIIDRQAVDSQGLFDTPQSVYDEKPFKDVVFGNKDLPPGDTTYDPPGFIEGTPPSIRPESIGRSPLSPLKPPILEPGIKPTIENPMAGASVLPPHHQGGLDYYGGDSTLPQEDPYLYDDRLYYVDPITGQDTGMSEEAFYDLWAQTPAGQFFGGNYEQFLNWAQHTEPGFLPPAYSGHPASGFLGDWWETWTPGESEDAATGPGLGLGNIWDAITGSATDFYGNLGDFITDSATDFYEGLGSGGILDFLFGEGGSSDIPPPIDPSTPGGFYLGEDDDDDNDPVSTFN